MSERKKVPFAPATLPAAGIRSCDAALTGSTTSFGAMLGRAAKSVAAQKIVIINIDDFMIGSPRAGLLGACQRLLSDRNRKDELRRVGECELRPRIAGDVVDRRAPRNP